MEKRDPLKEVANTGSNNDSQESVEASKQPDPNPTTSSDDSDNKENGFSHKTQKTIADSDVGCGSSKPKETKPRRSILKTFDPLYKDSPEKLPLISSTKSEQTVQHQLIIEDSDDSEDAHSSHLVEVSDDDDETAFIDASTVTDEPPSGSIVPENRHLDLEESLLKFYTPEKVYVARLGTDSESTSTSEAAENQPVLANIETSTSTSDQSNIQQETHLCPPDITESEIVSAITRKLSSDCDIIPTRSKFTITESELENYNILRERFSIENRDQIFRSRHESASDPIQTNSLTSVSEIRNISPERSRVGLETENDEPLASTSGEQRRHLESVQTVDKEESSDDSQESKITVVDKRIVDPTREKIEDRSVIAPGSFGKEQSLELKETVSSDSSNSVNENVTEDTDKYREEEDSFDDTNRRVQEIIKKCQITLNLLPELFHEPQSESNDKQTEKELSSGEISASHSEEFLEKGSDPEPESHSESGQQEEKQDFSEKECLGKSEETIQEKSQFEPEFHSNPENKDIGPQESGQQQGEKQDFSEREFQEQSVENLQEDSQPEPESHPTPEDKESEQQESGQQGEEGQDFAERELEKRVLEESHPNPESDLKSEDKESESVQQQEERQDFSEREFPGQSEENVQEESQPKLESHPKPEDKESGKQESGQQQEERQDFSEKEFQEQLEENVQESEPKPESSPKPEDKESGHQESSQQGEERQDFPGFQGQSQEYVEEESQPNSESHPKPVDKESEQQESGQQKEERQDFLEREFQRQLEENIWQQLDPESYPKLEDKESGQQELPLAGTSKDTCEKSDNVASDSEVESHPEQKLETPKEKSESEEATSKTAIESTSAPSGTEPPTSTGEVTSETKTEEVEDGSIETEKPSDVNTTIESDSAVYIQQDEDHHLDSGVDSIEESYVKSPKSPVGDSEDSEKGESQEISVETEVCSSQEQSPTDDEPIVKSGEEKVDEDCKTVTDSSAQDDEQSKLLDDPAERKIEEEPNLIKEPAEPEIEKATVHLPQKQKSDIKITDIDTFKAKMADLSEKLSEQQQENSDLKLQLNAIQQAKASLELEIRQKEEVIIKTQAEALKNEQTYKQEIKQLREKLKENSKLIERDGSKELEDQLKEAKAKEAKAVAELNQRTKDDLNYQKIMEEYETTIATRFADFQKLKEEHETATRHLANIELAFSDVHQKYERTKALLEGFKNNEEALNATLQVCEKTCKQHEEKYESLKAHAKGQIEKSNKEILTLRDKYEMDINKFKAIVKRLEIKCSSLEVSLQQKTEECAALSALCDEVTGKRV